MSCILVTGGTGYIGSHTVVELIESGYSVVIIDDFSNSTPDVAQRIEQITGTFPQVESFDICDRDRLAAFFDSYNNIDAVIHFAAKKSIGESMGCPLTYYRNNIVALLNILDEMIKRDIPSIVFSSSCSVYGQPKVLPVSEQLPLQPAESPYSNTKRIAEEILADMVKAHTAISAIALRYFNPIGAHPSALIGELVEGKPETLVPFITQTAAGLQPELQVFGDDYNTSDGSCIRDFLHVVDLAKAHVIAVTRLIEQKNKKPFEVFNLGAGRGVSVLEAINSFERVSGQKLKYRIVKRRTGDIEKIWADTTLANKELGWQTQSSLDEAMLTAWQWQKRCSEIK